MQERTLLTIPMAAKRVNLSRTMLWRHVDEGRLPAERVGRDWLIDADDLAKFEAVRRKPGRPQKHPAPA